MYAENVKPVIKPVFCIEHHPVAEGKSGGGSGNSLGDCGCCGRNYV